MLSRDEVLNLYRLILDREAESDQVIAEKRKAKSVLELATEMMSSDEFINRNREWIAKLGHGSPATHAVARPPAQPLRQRLARRVVARLLRTSAGQSLKRLAQSVQAQEGRG